MGEFSDERREKIKITVSKDGSSNKARSVSDYEPYEERSVSTKVIVGIFAGIIALAIGAGVLFTVLRDPRKPPEKTPTVDVTEPVTNPVEEPVGEDSGEDTPSLTMVIGDQGLVDMAHEMGLEGENGSGTESEAATESGDEAQVLLDAFGFPAEPVEPLVEVQIPAEVAMQKTQDEVSNHARYEGFDNGILQADGTITYYMTRAVYNEHRDAARKELESAVAKYQIDDSKGVDSISTTNDKAHITVAMEGEIVKKEVKAIANYLLDLSTACVMYNEYAYEEPSVTVIGADGEEYKTYSRGGFVIGAIIPSEEDVPEEITMPE